MGRPLSSLFGPPDDVITTPAHRRLTVLDDLPGETLDNGPQQITRLIGRTCQRAASTLRVLRAAGAPPDRLREIERGGHVDIHDIHVEAVHAEHTEDSVGYVLAASKHNVYHTGDTVESPQLYWLHDRGIEVLITGFAGRWEAMEANQAAGLAEALGARVVIPMHYETFAENSADPARLVQAVQQRPTCRAWVRVLSLNERFLYPPID